MNLEEITPPDSVVPVFIDSAPRVPVEDFMGEDTATPRQSAIDKLVALGLTEDEAKAIAGA